MKRTLYKTIVQVSNSSGDVCSAACTCLSGIGLGGFGNCNHIGGVLFALKDFNRKGLQQSPDPVSCTSKLSAWNVPSASTQNFNPEPIDSSPFSDIYDISCNPFKEMMDIFCDNFNLTKDEVDAIEKSTGGQSSNGEWKQQRKYRITASNFYSAAVNTVEPSSKLKSMFYATFSSASTKAM